MALVVLVPALCDTGQQAPLVLLDFADSFGLSSVSTSDARAVLSPAGALRVETGCEKKWPGITLKAP